MFCLSKRKAKYMQSVITISAITPSRETVFSNTAIRDAKSSFMDFCWRTKSEMRSISSCCVCENEEANKNTNMLHKLAKHV